MRTCVPAIVLSCLLAGTAAADGRRIAAGLRGLQSEHASDRVRAVRALAAFREEPERARAVRGLQRALFDAAPYVRRDAVRALVALDARAAGGDIVRLLELERDGFVLPSALLALGRLRVRGAEGVLTRFASHPDASARAAALGAAGDLAGPAMRRLVLNSLGMAGDEDSTWLVRSSAVLALAKIGRREDLTAIQKAYDEGGGRAYWLARAAVAKAVAALHPAPRATLERLLTDADPRVAVTAAKGLADAGLAPVLLEHLRNPKSSIRAAAVGGVRQAQLRTAAPTLKRLARYDRSRDVRWAAAKVLFAWDDPYGDTLILDALRSSEAAIWAEAHALLARRTGESHERDVDAWRKALKRRRR